ncbi:hypothetical protein PCNPT3_04665 [Psychromonas sp. CNPT3]|uniref:hypothetical protein n=1 Tax=Psychromonas sp. CNPT3 TaxID=314282 RepID=UPI00006E4291|nr:hypothetical protein [Psychromonas sp. CNPT3]AGH80875.1 hypothetical protein PCNPT3_04665 [Psychromonas sp. CNPT3]
MYLGKIPNITQDDPDVIAKLQTFIESCVDEFSAGLIGDLSHINLGAECSAGINVEGLHKITEGEYQLNYSYTWFIYNGCADMDESDSVEGATVIYMSDDGDIDIKLLEVEARNTIDEF